MRKLVFVIIGLFALFSLISAYTDAKEQGNASVSVDVLVQDPSYRP